MDGREAIGIVGAGPVACALGRLLLDRGAPVVALASRTRARAETASAFIGPAVRTLTCAELARTVTSVLIASSDTALQSVAEELAGSGLRSGAALHTSGAQSAAALGPLRRVGVACGVLHPFQTVISAQEGVRCLPGATFRVEGDTAALAWARELVGLLGGSVIQIASDRTPTYHAAAVMAGNAVTALVDAAVLLLERSGVDRALALDAVASLSRTTLENTLRVGPEAALTGPIARGDAATVRAHVEALSMHAPELESLYKAIGLRLMDVAARRGLPQARLDLVGAELGRCRAGDHNGR